jgi:hypothetical protein
MRDLESCGKSAVLQGVGEMEAGLEQCKEPDDEKLFASCLSMDCGKVGQFCRGEWKGSMRTECNWGA